MTRLEFRYGEGPLLDFSRRVDEKPSIWWVVFLFQCRKEVIDVVAEDNGTS